MATKIAPQSIATLLFLQLFLILLNGLATKASERVQPNQRLMLPDLQVSMLIHANLAVNGQEVQSAFARGAVAVHQAFLLAELYVQMSSDAHAVEMMTAFAESIHPFVFELDCLLTHIADLKVFFLCSFLDVVGECSFCYSDVCPFGSRLCLDLMSHIVEDCLLKVRCIYFFFFLVVGYKESPKEEKSNQYYCTSEDYCHKFCGIDLALSFAIDQKILGAGIAGLVHGEVEDVGSAVQAMRVHAGQGGCDKGKSGYEFYHDFFGFDYQLEMLLYSN